MEQQSASRTDYLARATEARNAACRSFDVKTRQDYIAIAQQWEMMALRAEQQKLREKQ
jgi:hypothetical protein